MDDEEEKLDPIFVGPESQICKPPDEMPEKKPLIGFGEQLKPKGVGYVDVRDKGWLGRRRL